MKTKKELLRMISRQWTTMHENEKGTITNDIETMDDYA